MCSKNRIDNRNFYSHLPIIVFFQLTQSVSLSQKNLDYIPVTRLGANNYQRTIHFSVLK